jgi:hypothetical protein
VPAIRRVFSIICSGNFKTGLEVENRGFGTGMTNVLILTNNLFAENRKEYIFQNMKDCKREGVEKKQRRKLDGM